MPRNESTVNQSDWPASPELTWLPVGRRAETGRREVDGRKLGEKLVSRLTKLRNVFLGPLEPSRDESSQLSGAE